MRRVLKQILLFILVTAILFTNIQISQAAGTGTVRVNDFYQMKSQEESTIIKEEKSQEEGDQEKDSSDYKDKEDKKEEKKEDRKEDKKEEKDKEDVINNTVRIQEEKNEVIPEEQEMTEKKAESQTEKEEDIEDISIKDAKEPEQVQEATESQQSKEEEEREQLERVSGYTLRTVRPDTNHSVTMPDITSHYFLLQKNSKKVNAASGGNLAVVADANAASKYIYESYSNGKQYNFTPRFTSKTTVTVGGGNGGGVSFATVKKGPEKQFGDVYDAVKDGRIVSKVFNLDKCSENPYAIYTNVGTWYDYGSKRTYAIDMKMTVTGYKFPGAAVRKQLANKDLKAPYIGFGKSKIGITVMGTDYLQTRLEFYYSGTTTAVAGIKGMIQFCDIDAQQGVDFGNGFEKIVMFNTSQSKLQYNKNGLIAGSKGYVSSRISTDLNSNNEHTTAMGIFSGSSVNCRWTVAKCDQKDTGGDAAYGVKGGYGIPAESTLENSNSYYWSNSTGFLGVRADVGIAPLPEEVIKSVYVGNVNGQNSEKGSRFAGLSERNQVFTYVLSAVAPTPSNVKNAQYTMFQIEDRVDALLNVKSVKVYADEAVSNNFQTMGINYSDMTSYFHIIKREEADHSTTVQVKAVDERLGKSAFYGRTYYIHIEVEVKSDQELHAIHRSIAEWYQENETLKQKVPEAGSCKGSVAVSNNGTLYVKNDKGSTVERKSNDVASKIAMKLRVKKLDEESGKPVKGVVFGLFGGSDKNLAKEPLYTATTDDNGVALFTSMPSYTFYKEPFGNGPYYIKEISIPEEYKNVWNPSVDTNWYYEINTLKTEELFDNTASITENKQLINKNYEAGKNIVKVYKKSTDTGAYLSGAEFVLYQWSAATGSYRELFALTEGKDEEGHPVYQNKETFKNTLDNLGKYKITEKKAPKGCILTGQEWTFELSENSKEDGSNIIFENTVTGKRQTGALIYRNPLQKAKLTIIKKDDENQSVEGAVFTVRAAEDIYAPWDLQENKKPLKEADPLISKGSVADRIVTGKDGKGTSTEGSELYIGKYVVEETTGALDHIKGDDIYEVELTYGIEQNNPFVIYMLDASNVLMRPAFSVAKIADKTTNEEGKAVLFDEKTGRYIEKKQAGIYKAGEMVDYTIRVTNTGNVPLYQIRLTDDMDRKGEFSEQTLSKYADMETATFVVPNSGILKTREGDKVAVHLSLESDLVLVLQHLNVNDSVDIHVKVRLKEDAKDAWKLRNDVYAEAKYADNGTEEKGDIHLRDVSTDKLIDGEGNSLVTDWDFINVPGSPGEDVIKTADKTTGITIENGEITSGIKIPGIYGAKDKVRFSIIVKNNGEAALKNITVKDAMSDELKAIVNLESAKFIFDETQTTEEGLYILTTAHKKKITAKVVDKDTILLCSTGEDGDGTDRLWADDYIVLYYEADLLPGIANIYNVSNKVCINGWYFDGNKDVEVPEKEDEDKIEIPGVPEGRAAKLADRTKGAVLEAGRYNAEAKISGVYENGTTVTYKITVTNNGTSNLYDLYLQDTLSEELEKALEKESVSFEESIYTSQNGRKVRTSLEEPQRLWMDFLAAGDAVDVFLKGKVRLDVGNLFELKNIVELTARYKKGNEEAYKEYEEKMEKEKRRWKLQYDANNGSGEIETDSETPCREGNKITVNGNAFLYEGHYFTEWNTNPDGSGERWNPDTAYNILGNDVKLYAQWKKNPDEKEEEASQDYNNQRKYPVYNLIYHSNNKKEQIEADEENSRLAGTLLTVNENRFSYPGFTFKGWNTRKDGKGKQYTPEEVVEMPARNLNLYAQWEKRPVYHLQYDANNGSGKRRTDAETPCEAGTKVQIDGNAYRYEAGRDCYMFTQWNTRPDGKGDAYKPGEEKEINTDIILYAQWEKLQDNAEDIEKYHVFYRANNNTTAFSVDPQTPKEAGNSILLQNNRFFYADYLFAGWNTKADGSGKQYNSGDTFVIPSKNISLYAQWKKIEQKKLIYSSNTKAEEKYIDAECFSDDGEDEEKEVLIDGNSFHNNGKKFVGWNTKIDGSGKRYAPSEKFTLKENTVLYAQWSKDVKQYKLVYHSNYPSKAEETKEEQKEIDSETPAYAGTKIKINKNYFSCGGYKFTGWSTKKTGEAEYLPTQWYVMPEKDVDLYACWSKADEHKKEDTNNPEDKEENKKEDKEEDKNEEDKNDNNKDDEKKDDEKKDEAEEDTKKDPMAEEARKAIEKAYEEIQKLAIEELKEESKKYTEIPVTELMKDEDTINIPGTPVAKVSKLADKTQGVTLVKGRYEGIKKEGIYEYGDVIDYTVNISNEGTADLYDLVVEDFMDKSLQEIIKPGTVTIVSGQITTKQGNTVCVERMPEKEDEEGKYIVHLDKLKAADSVVLHMKAEVQTGVQAGTHLNNAIHITAQYETVNDNGKREKIYIIETPEMTDNDTVGIGVPDIVVAKKSDKTKNIVLENGRYTGKRKYGTYKAGEEIKFTITVSNSGTASARNITIKEEPSKELKKYVQMKGFAHKAGSSIRSKKSNTVKVKEIKNKKVFLDKIEAGDSVELIYTAKVKKDIPSIKFLKNEVSLEGKNKDGSDIPITPKMDDYDKVNLKENSKPMKKNKDQGTPGAKTGDNNTIAMYLLVGLLSLSMIFIILYFQKRKKDNI